MNLNLVCLQWTNDLTADFIIFFLKSRWQAQRSENQLTHESQRRGFVFVWWVSVTLRPPARRRTRRHKREQEQTGWWECEAASWQGLCGHTTHRHRHTHTQNNSSLKQDHLSALICLKQTNVELYSDTHSLKSITICVFQVERQIKQTPNKETHTHTL